MGLGYTHAVFNEGICLVMKTMSYVDGESNGNIKAMPESS